MINWGVCTFIVIMNNGWSILRIDFFLWLIQNQPNMWWAPLVLGEVVNASWLMDFQRLLKISRSGHRSIITTSRIERRVKEHFWENSRLIFWHRFCRRIPEKLSFGFWIFDFFWILWVFSTILFDVWLKTNVKQTGKEIFLVFFYNFFSFYDCHHNKCFWISDILSFLILFDFLLFIIYWDFSMCGLQVVVNK